MQKTLCHMSLAIVQLRQTPFRGISQDTLTLIECFSDSQSIGAPFVVPPGLTIVPNQFFNSLDVMTYGVETTGAFQLNSQWKFLASYSVFQAQADDASAHSELNGRSPHNQVYLRSSWDLQDDVQFDLAGRYVDSLTNLSVPKYFEMDARIGWQATENLELSFVGQEFVGQPSP